MEEEVKMTKVKTEEKTKTPTQWSNKEKLSDLSDKQDEETIKKLSKQIIKLGGKINLDQKLLS